MDKTNAPLTRVKHSAHGRLKCHTAGAGDGGKEGGSWEMVDGDRTWFAIHAYAQVNVERRARPELELELQLEQTLLQSARCS